jgi:hypothetical protein
VTDGIGREMAGQFGLRFRLPRKPQGSFTCRKSATWDRRLYFPSEGRLRPSSNPRSWVPEASMLTTRPPKSPCIGVLNLDNYVGCLRDTVYQDPVKLHNCCTKDCPQFIYLILLHYVSCIKMPKILFDTVLYWFGYRLMIPRGSKM